jgi:PmbA protein
MGIQQPQPTGLNPIALRERLEQLASQQGVRQWDLGASCGTDTSVQVDRGEAKQMKGAQRSAITIRVWNQDGLVGVTSTSDLSDAGLAVALASAQEASPFGNEEDTPAFSPLAKAPLPHLEQPIQPQRSILDLLETLKDAERQVLDRHPAIGTLPYNGLAQRDSERLYLNSEGACRHQHLTTASIYLYARAEEVGRKPRSGGAVRLAYGPDDLDMAGCVEEAAERTIAHLDYAPIPTGRYVCVFSPEAFLDLIGAFSGMFNARAVLDGVSLSRGNPWGIRWPFPSSPSTTTAAPWQHRRHRLRWRGHPHQTPGPGGGRRVEEFPALGGHGAGFLRLPHRSCRDGCQGLRRP